MGETITMADVLYVPVDDQGEPYRWTVEDEVAVDVFGDFWRARRTVGHSILVICYHVLERGVPYEELGEDYFDRHRSGEAYAKRLVRKLERLGQKVALEPLPRSA